MLHETGGMAGAEEPAMIFPSSNPQEGSSAGCSVSEVQLLQ